MKPGEICRCITTFEGVVQNELTLYKGELFQVLSVEDKMWVYGISGAGRGKVPAASLIIEDINSLVPAGESHDVLFVASADFSSIEEGDLALMKDTVVVGIEALGDSWWRGRAYGKEGIFPHNFVWRIDTELLKSATVSEQSVCMTARVVHNFVPQLDEELLLTQGAVVKITHLLEGDWYRGHCHGKTGIFPSSYVKIIEESATDNNLSNSTNGNTVQWTSNIKPSFESNVYHPPEEHVNTKPVECSSGNDHLATDTTLRNDTYSENLNNITNSYTSSAPKDDDANRNTFTNNEPTAVLSNISNKWKESIDDNTEDDLFNDDYFKINMPGMYQEKRSSKLGTNLSDKRDNLIDNAGSSSLVAHDNSCKTAQKSLSTLESRDVAVTRVDTITREVDSHFAARNPLRPSHSTNVKRGVTNFNRYDNEVDEMLNVGYNEDNTGINPYGRALYDFTAQYANELTFKKDDIIHLIKHLDSHWTLGMLGEDRGMFPTSYIDIIVDCIHNSVESFLLRPLSTAEIPDHEGYAVVEYAFSPTQLGDLSVTAGEYIKITENIDSSWAIVSKVNGQKGMCPKNHFRLVSAEEYNQQCNINAIDKFLEEQSMKLSLNTETDSGIDNLMDLSTPSKITTTGKSSIDDLLDIDLSGTETPSEMSDVLPQKRTYSKDDFGPVKFKQLDEELNKNLTNISLASSKVAPKNKLHSLDYDKESKSQNKSLENEAGIPESSSNVASHYKQTELTLESTSIKALNQISQPHHEEVRQQPSVPKPSRPPLPSRASLSKTESFKALSSNQDVEEEASLHEVVLHPSNNSSVETVTSETVRRPGNLRRQSAVERTMSVLEDDNRIIRTGSAESAAAFPHDMKSPTLKTAASFAEHNSFAPARPAPPPPSSARPSPPLQCLETDDQKSESLATNECLTGNTTDETNDSRTSKTLDRSASSVSRSSSNVSTVDKSVGNVHPVNRSASSVSTVDKSVSNVHPVNRSASSVSAVSKSDSNMHALNRLTSKISRVGRTDSTASEISKFHVDLEEDKLSADKYLVLRRELVQELVTTEHEYSHDLEAMLQVASITASDAKKAQVDLPTLIGNLDQLIEASKALSKSLAKEAFNEDSSMCIGKVFVTEADRLCAVYKIYCAQHTTVVEPLITQYQENSSQKQYLDTVLQELQQHKIQLLDMRSVLIKPVQRILKYPLFLDRLLSFTSPEHCDYKNIQEATKAMASVATLINTYTKRLDMVRKYGHSGEDSTLLRMQRISLHSIAKKSARVTTRLTASLGLTTLTEDPKMTSLDADYKCLMSAIRSLEQHSRAAVSFVNEKHRAELAIVEGLAVTLLTDKNDSTARLLSALDNVRTVTREVVNNPVHLFQRAIIMLVADPLSEVSALTSTTDRLIQKRHHKLLDYDAAQHKMDRNRDPTRTRILEEELIKARSDYDALNGQLLDELPLFLREASGVFRNALKAYISARALLQGRIAKRFCSLKQDLNDSLNQSSNHKLVACRKISELSFVPEKHFGCLNNEVSIPSPSRRRKRSMIARSIKKQSENCRQALLNKYHNRVELLYTLSADHISSENMNLNLAKGAVVAVLKNKDPTGSSLRWYVDDGKEKGFVLASHLVPQRELAPAPSSEPLPPSTAAQLPSSTLPIRPTSLPSANPPKYEDIFPSMPSNTVVESHPRESLQATHQPAECDATNTSDGVNKAVLYDTNNIYEEIDECDTVDKSDSSNIYEYVEEDQPGEFYYALYNFGGDKNNHQLSLYEGQVVLLLQGDNNSSNEALPSLHQWYFVEDRDGQQGYVPASYLAKYS